MKRRAPAPSVNHKIVAQSVLITLDAFLHGLDHPLHPHFLDRIEKFVELITLWGVKMNLTAHPEDPDEIAFHVIDSLMPLVLADGDMGELSALFTRDQKVVDLGSGAGFPGLVLAAASDAHFTLVESRRKRASFLQVASAEMGLDNVVMEARRAEELDSARRFNLATSRAFGDPMEFFGLASRILKSGGLAMLYASPSQRFGLEVTRIPYHVDRRGQRVERILALRRQA